MREKRVKLLEMFVGVVYEFVGLWDVRREDE